MIKLLVVDDSLFMRNMLKTVLPKDIFEIVGEASNGREAFEKYQSLNPDLVTMDITMPEMDGISAVKKILSDDSNARIIMCSAMGQKPMVKEALEAGAMDFIVKPFDKKKTVKRLKDIAER
ncbi:MAG: response regulator [Fusobacteriota bacterium]